MKKIIKNLSELRTLLDKHNIIYATPTMFFKNKDFVMMKRPQERAKVIKKDFSMFKKGVSVEIPQETNKVKEKEAVEKFNLALRKQGVDYRCEQIELITPELYRAIIDVII